MQWPHPTPMPLDEAASYFRGTLTPIVEAQQSVQALHLIVAGSSSELLTSFQASIGREITEQQSAIFATIASLQNQLEDLHSTVSSAITKQQNLAKTSE
jgi:Ca2+/Na+ antiporter